MLLKLLVKLHYGVDVQNVTNAAMMPAQQQEQRERHSCGWMIPAPEG